MPLNQETAMYEKKPYYGPGRQWYLVAALLVAWAIVYFAWFFFMLYNELTSTEQFRIPATRELNLEEPGKYVIWNSVNTFFEGKTYSFDPQLPAGVIIKVINAAGMDFPLKKASGTESQSEILLRSAICSFTITEPGRYTISVTGLEEERIICVRKSLFKLIAMAMLQLFLYEFLGFIVAPIIIIIVAVKRNRAKKLLNAASGQ